MKLNYIEKTYAIGLLTILVGIVLHAPLSVGLGVLFPDYSLLIKSWKEIIMLLLVPLALIIVTRHRLWPSLLSDWVFHLIVAYTAVHLVLVGVLYQGVPATAAGLAIDLRYVLFFALVYVLLKALPHYHRAILLAVAAGVVIVVGFGVAQLFLPIDILKHIGYSTETIVPYLTVDQNHDYIRINSTLRGPNPVGAYALIVLSMLASFTLLKRRQVSTMMRRLAVAMLAAGGLIILWVSYSRSAILGAVAALGIIGLVTIGRSITVRGWLIISIIVCVGLGGLFAMRDSSFVANVIMHDDPSLGAVETSNEGHADSLQDGTLRLIDQPLGAGVGSTGSASLQGDSPVIIENQYLFIAHEAGWIGLGLFMALFVTILIRLWRDRRDWLSLAVFASGIGLGLIGILLPVFVDDTIGIIWWGLAAMALTRRKA